MLMIVSGYPGVSVASAIYSLASLNFTGINYKNKRKQN